MSTKPTADNDVRQGEVGTSSKKPSLKVKAVYAQIQEFFSLTALSPDKRTPSSVAPGRHRGLAKMDPPGDSEPFLQGGILMDLVDTVKGKGCFATING